MNIIETPKSISISLSGKRARLVKESPDPYDPLEAIIICPHCGREVRYADTCMNSGKTGCKYCITELGIAIYEARMANPATWFKDTDWEPYGV